MTVSGRKNPKPTIKVSNITSDNILGAVETTGLVTISGHTANTKAGDAVSLLVNGVTYTGLTTKNGTFSINVSGTSLVLDSDKVVNAKVLTRGTSGVEITASSTKSYVIASESSVNFTAKPLLPGQWAQFSNFASSEIATLNLTAGGADSTVFLTNTGAGIKTINFAGANSLSLWEDGGMASAVTTVDASAASGNLRMDASAGLIAGALKFTGGSGNDTLLLANDALSGLVSGSQLNGGAGTSDKIGIKDTVLSGAEAIKINASTGFEVLGLNAAINLDASLLTGIKSFSIDTSGLTQSISNLQAGSTVTITAATPDSLKLSTAIGVLGTSVVLGDATSTGVTVGELDIAATSLTLTSNGAGANAVALFIAGNSVINLKGAADLKLSVQADYGVAINGSDATGKLTLTGSSASVGDVIVGSAGNDVINGGIGADSMRGGGGADTFVFNATRGANTSGTSGAWLGQADRVEDFATGADKLQFAGVNAIESGQQVDVQAAVASLSALFPDMSGHFLDHRLQMYRSVQLDKAVAQAMAVANTTDHGVSFAAINGNTYVLYEFTGSGQGVVADDVFIKLVGVGGTPLQTFADVITL